MATLILLLIFVIGHTDFSIMASRLKDRIFVAETKDNRQEVTSQGHSRPHRYCDWSDVSMTKAMAMVEKGMSIRRASEMFGVPKSSLHDRVSGRVQHGSQPGKAPYLNRKEEEELVNFLVKCAGIGYPHTVAQILAIVQQIVDFKKLDKVVTPGWWQRFCQRHKGISLRTAMPLALTRAMATDSDCIERYYDLLEDTLVRNKIFNNPARIFNCDETGMALSPKDMKVVAKTGSKNVWSVTGDTKSQVTVLACTSASGIALPPFVIFDRKTLNPELTTGEIPGTVYGLSKKGWMNRELFMDWFFLHFLTSIPPVRPVLLLLDGHSSHYSPDLINAAAEELVLLFVLPPHTTHLTQPLDKGCFSPLKKCWKNVCHKFYCRNPGRVVSRFDFSTLFADAWKEAMSQKNILAGFKTTGICPFNRAKIQTIAAEFASPGFKPESLPQRTGLAYIPFYSPVGKKSRQQDLQSEVIDEFDSSSDISLHCSVLNRSVSEGDISGSSIIALPKRSTSVSRFLNTPLPPCKIPTKHTKSCGKVLTSLENRKAIEKKNREKEKIEKEKAERKAEREVKAKQKSEARARVKEERETKRRKATRQGIIIVFSH